MSKATLGDVLRFLHKAYPAHEARDRADGELLRRFVTQGEEAAFTVLVERHGPMVQGVCRRILGDLHSAEDSFQATFIVLARRAASLGLTGSLGTWLHAVARRIAWRAKIQTTTQRNRERRLGNMPRAERLDDATWQELRAILDEEIGRLPEKYRAPLLLYHFENKTRIHVAQELGWPEGTVARRLSRGRELLRQQLTRRGITLSAGVLGAVLGDKVAATPVAALLTLTTVKGAASIFSNKAVAAGCFSARAVALAEEAMRGALWIKGKLLLMVLALGLVLGGAGWAGYCGLADTSQQAPPATTQQPVAKNQAGIPPGAVRPASDPGPRLDGNGDRLPFGALARLGTTRFRLGNSLLGMALSPDGGTAISVGGKSQTQFWDLTTGKAIRRIDFKQGGGGRAVAYSPDGRLAASVQDVGILDIWEAATGKHLAELGLKMRAFSVAFSPDGVVLAACGFRAKYGRLEQTSSTSVVSVWRWNGTALKPLWEANPDHEAPMKGPRPQAIMSLAFSSDGKELATGGSANNIIRLWDVARGKEVRQMTVSGTLVRALAFAPSEKALASGSDDGVVALWNPDTGMNRWQRNQTGEVRALAYAPDGKTLAACGGPDRIEPSNTKIQNHPFLVLLDPSNGREVRRIDTAKESVAAVAYSKDGKVLAAGLGGTIRVWDAITGKERTFSNGHNHMISSVAVSEDGKSAVTAGGDGAIILWDLASGSEKRRMKGDQGWVRAAGFVPGGKRLASASEQTVHLWELATGNESRRLEERAKGAIHALAISPDGKTLASGDYQDGSVHIWDLVTGQQVHALTIGDKQGHGIMCLAFSPDGGLLAGGETTLNTKRLAVKSRVLFWDAKTGKKLREVPADEMAVTSLAFSPDGKMLASTGWEGQRIRFWDVESGKGLLDLPCGSGHGVVAFSPDGKTFAWGSLTGEVWLLETASKQLRQKFSGHITFVSSLAFSPDGWVLVSASADTTAIVWDVTGLKSHATTAPLSRDRLGSLWSDLANLDAEKAGRAIWRLAADPKYAVPFIVERLRELPPGDAQRIPQLVADLDSPIFKVREAAEKNLEALGKLAVPSLGEALVRQASLEAKHRIEKLLSKREAPIQSPEVLHVLRALEVLEHVGTPEARQALDDLASHAPEQYFRQEARAAAERLRKR